MGQCNESLLSYGIIIPVSKAVALLNALRKIPPPPGDSSSRDTDKIDNTEDWEYGYTHELGERIGSQFVAAGFDWQEFELETLGNEREWQGVAVFFNGVYDEGTEDYSKGLGVDFWGRDCMTCTKCIVHKPWEDEEFMKSAKKSVQGACRTPVIQGDRV